MGQQMMDNFNIEEITRIQKEGSHWKVYFFAKGTRSEIPFQCSNDPELLKFLEKEKRQIIGRTVFVDFTTSGKVRALELV